MTESGDHTFTWMCRLDAKLDQMLAILEGHTGRLRLVEGRLTSLTARFAVIETSTVRLRGSTIGSSSIDGVSRGSRT